MQGPAMKSRPPQRHTPKEHPKTDRKRLADRERRAALLVAALFFLGLFVRVLRHFIDGSR